MKFRVGDYVRVGVTIFLYFRIIEVNGDNYYLKRCVPGGKVLFATSGLLRSTTFVKVNKTEVLLNSFNRRFNG